MAAQARSWLVPTEADRARMLEAGVRVRGARMVASLACGAFALILVPWHGWLPVLVFVLSAVQLSTLDRRVAGSARPERLIATNLTFTAAVIGAAIVLTGGPGNPFLPLLALPAGMLANRFRRPVVLAGLAWCVAVLGVATGVPDPAALLADPRHVAATVALLVGVVAITLALSEAELQHRAESRLDHLTGLLNRTALAPRALDLANEASETSGTLAVVLCDLDRFKAVNDLTATIRATASCARRPPSCVVSSAPRISPTGSEARSSRSCCPASRPKRRSRPPSACGSRCPPRTPRASS